MELTHIEHIGIAVENLEESIKYYENVLGSKMLCRGRSCGSES
jgi:methylmalonyl-CoA/ethylmalonyl-CoA epimerase